LPGEHKVYIKPAIAGRRFVMASIKYCSNIGEELEVWSSKLHELSRKIDRMPSIDKYRLLPHIEELHIVMTEMDDRLCEVLTACPAVEPLEKEEPGMLGACC
jgi:hypothetical protein